MCALDGHVCITLDRCTGGLPNQVPTTHSNANITVKNNNLHLVCEWWCGVSTQSTDWFQERVRLWFYTRTKSMYYKVTPRVVWQICQIWTLTTKRQTNKTRNKYTTTVGCINDLQLVIILIATVLIHVYVKGLSNMCCRTKMLNSRRPMDQNRIHLKFLNYRGV